MTYVAVNLAARTKPPAPSRAIFLFLWPQRLSSARPPMTRPSDRPGWTMVASSLVHCNSSGHPFRSHAAAGSRSGGVPDGYRTIHYPGGRVPRSEQSSFQ